MLRMQIDKGVESLKGVGPVTQKELSRIGIKSIADLLCYYPRSHDDYSNIVTISKLHPGVVTIRAKIDKMTGRYVRRGMHVTEAVATDNTGSVRIVWFNQPYRSTTTKPDEEYFITGKFELRSGRFAISSPATESTKHVPLHMARIVPKYRETKEISAKIIRSLMAQAIKFSDQLVSPLPLWLHEKHHLTSYGDALKQLHFPDSKDMLELAKHTLAFIEVFELMLGARLNRSEVESETAPMIPFNKKVAKAFVKKLPFSLTEAQRKVTWQIIQDLEKTVPMNRLVEGDVGSGKTVVAALSAVMTMHAGYQVALLAPTEILARQHAESLHEMLKSIDLENEIGLLVGGMSGTQKKAVKLELEKGTVRFVIGTHALLQETVAIKNLGLLIIDEQHRFGVEQRKNLLKHSAKMPHVLSMTATPIPRSLALTLYGDLAISRLDALPPGRKKILTNIVSPNSRQPMYEHLISELKAGHQAYIVCPLIADGASGAPNAETVYKQLTQKELKGFTLGLMHGKLTNEQKTKTMEDFVSGKINVLVSTTVIEVGVNVPNATVMIIEGVDRFGLAQLHQLRGRVGRSEDQATCYIVPSDSKKPSKRIELFARSSDGFELAEKDLELRGPGAIYGTLQHGALDLRFATLNDTKLLITVRDSVQAFLDSEEKISRYPVLARRVRLAQAVVALN
jgi:ATP-dependent DNA helicase RecG